MAKDIKYGEDALKALQSGVNAAISGDMLTTSGIKTCEDIEMVKSLGFQVQNYIYYMGYIKIRLSCLYINYIYSVMVN